MSEKEGIVKFKYENGNMIVYNPDIKAVIETIKVLNKIMMLNLLKMMLILVIINTYIHSFVLSFFGFMVEAVVVG